MAAQVARANLPEVRNPILRLPAAQELMALPADQRAVIKRILRDLKAQCRVEEARVYRQRKGPLVQYYMAMGTIMGHLANVAGKGLK